MIEPSFHTFLNSEPWSTELAELNERSMDLKSDSGDLDVTQYLFTSLLDDKPVDVNNWSGSDSDDLLFHYLDGGSMTKTSKRKPVVREDEDNIDVVGDGEVLIASKLQVSDSSINGLNMTDSSDNNVITLFAKDLPRVTSEANKTDELKVRKKPPLLSNNRKLVVKIPRIDARRSDPHKYCRGNSVGPDESNSISSIKIHNGVNKSHSESDANSDDEALPSISKRTKCFSKNAILAREVRARKKKYVEGLENSVNVLKNEKIELESKLIAQASHVKSLENEVQYLRNVIANESTISALLHNIKKTPGISVTSSLKCSNKRKNFDENQENTANGIYVRTSPRIKKKKIDGEDLSPMTKSVESGVCLHVANNHVSLEFCSQCSGSAVEAWNEEANSEAEMPLKAVQSNNITRNRC